MYLRKLRNIFNYSKNIFLLFPYYHIYSYNKQTPYKNKYLDRLL